MSYVRVDSSVRTNRKFLQAGPAASWLWLCATAYSQETLTDGFIPFEAVKFLGVDNPKPLISKLVKARLFDERDGGWTIHDYLEHNKSADAIKKIKDAKKQSGKQGGEASGRSRVLHQSANPLVDVDVAVAAAVAVVPEEKGVADFPYDVALRKLTAEYPTNRRTSGYATSSAFFEEFQKDGRDPEDVWSDMLQGLRNQLDGHEWRVKGMVPKLEKWLREGLWKQRHEAAPASVLVTDKTAGTLAAAAEILKGKAS